MFICPLGLKNFRMSLQDLRNKRAGYNPDARWSKYNKDLDDYMQELYGQYGNTPYWAEFASNPYLNFAYDPKRPGNDYWTEMSSNYYRDAMVHINNVLTKIREEGYNTESSQVKRQQEAGLNPDLNGVNPSQATEATELPQNPIPSLNEYEQMKFDRAVQGSNLGINFLQQFLGMAEGVVGLRNSSLQNGALELKNVGEAEDYLIDRFTKELLAPYDASPKGAPSFDEIWNEMIERIKDPSIVGRYAFSKKSRKFLSGVAEGLKGDNAYMRSKAEKMYNDYVTNRWNRVKGMAHPLWDNDGEEMISKVSEGLSSIEYENWKLQQDLQSKVNQFRLTYQNEAIALGNDVAQAGLENVQISNATSYAQQLANEGVPEESARQERRQLELQKLQYEIEKARKEAIEAAEREFRQIQERYLSGDKWYHALGRLILPAIRQFVTQSTNAYFSSLGSQLASFKAPSLPPPVSNDSSSDFPNF